MSNRSSERPQPPVGPPLVGALLRMPLDVVQARILARLEDEGFTDLNAAHLAVLRWPGPENRRPSDLAREVRMSKQAMNYLLGDLERLGYITRQDDPDDQRSKRVHLTKRGRAIVPTIRTAVRQLEVEWERELGRGRFKQLRELLTDLNATSVVRDFHGGRA